MKKWRVRFEFYGRRMQTTVIAESKVDAIKQVAARLRIDEVELDDDDGLLDDMMDLLGIGKRKKK